MFNLSEKMDEIKDEIAKETQQDRFIGTPTNLDGVNGYQIEQIHNGQTVVSQFVPDLAAWEEATGIEVEISDDDLII